MEHGGTLLDMSIDDLVRNATEEAIDQYTYLHAISRKLRSTGLVDPAFIEMLGNEMARAVADHGPLTLDLFRAFTILSEEVGETARALLELRRAQNPFRTGQRASSCAEVDEERALRKKVVDELVQVASVAAMMARNLNYGK